MTERRQGSKTAWVGIVVTIAIAVAGWTFALVGALARSELNAETEARKASDNAITATLDRVALNTKDVPALIAEMHIVLSKLNLDGTW